MFLGWTQHAFSWCTASGRTILKYGSEKAPITAAQCQALCVAKAGCKAIEHWNKFNYACFWCTDTSKITPYNNQNDLAYPAHVYVQSKSLFSCFAWKAQIIRKYKVYKQTVWIIKLHVVWANVRLYHKSSVKPGGLMNGELISNL